MLDRAKARFDSHRQASVGSALQDRGKPQQDSSVGDDLKKQQDTRHSLKRLAEDIQMQDVLRRLQMLEEVEHAKVLRSIPLVWWGLHVWCTCLRKSQYQ